MSTDLLQLLGAWLSNSWNVIESFTIPGTTFSLGVLLLGASVAGASVGLLRKLFGALRGGAQRGGNNGNIKVNEKRNDDTK